MFEYDTAEKIVRIQGQLFENGRFKSSLDSSEIAKLYKDLEDLEHELKDQYAYKKRLERESQLRRELA